jgi:glycosyltransferase involved in cell wall biosynthesis
MTSSPKTPAASSLRILMVPLKPWPTDHAMLESVYARIFPGRGHRVDWLMWSGSPASGTTSWHGTEVHLTRYGSGSVLAAAGRWWRLLRAMDHQLRSGTFDLVQVRNSSAAGALAILLRRRTRTKVVFQLSFPVAEWVLEAARRHEVRAPRVRSALAPMQIALRRAVVGRADLVLAISERMRSDLIRDGAPASRVVVFPLGADEPSGTPPAEIETLRRTLGIGADPLVLYFGAISPQRKLGFLVEVAVRVANRHPTARWILIGPSASGGSERLVAAAAAAGLGGRFDVLDPVPRSEIASYLAAATLTVSPVPLDDVYLPSSPTKVVESLASGRPVVATPIPDQETVLRESAGGVIAPFDADAFAGAVAGLLDDPDEARAMGERGRVWVHEHRSYEHLADTVEEAYRRLGEPK